MRVTRAGRRLYLDTTYRDDTKLFIGLEDLRPVFSNREPRTGTYTGFCNPSAKRYQIYDSLDSAVHLHVTPNIRHCQQPWKLQRREQRQDTQLLSCMMVEDPRDGKLWSCTSPPMEALPSRNLDARTATVLTTWASIALLPRFFKGTSRVQLHQYMYQTV